MAKSWAYTSLAEGSSIRLVIGDQNFQVAAFTGSWAINQVPEAMCAIALGRNVRNVNQTAAIHALAGSLRSMTKAQVYLSLQGEFTPDGARWPEGEQLIFDGYYVGYGSQKINGKVHFMAHLSHWLLDFSFTSSLSSISHPDNPTSLTFPAIMEPFSGGESGGSTSGIFITQYLHHDTILADLSNGDLWMALRNLMCAMAQSEGFSPACGLASTGLSALKTNDRVQRALARMEGPGGSKNCNGLEYKYAKALPIAVADGQAYSGMAEYIGRAAADQLVRMTTWDIMVGLYCPMFGLDLCPAADRSIVVASLPGYRGATWRVLPPDEYEFVDQAGMLAKPLRAVVVHGAYSPENGSNFNDSADSFSTCMTGTFVSTAVEDGDGVVLYQQMPDWLGNISLSGQTAGDSSGAKDNQPHNSATTPNQGKAASDKTPAQMRATVQDLLDRYAHTLYVQHALRGRSGTISGKLRFDIGPGSHLQLLGSAEAFIGSEDALAADLFAQVNRVTVEINAEGRRASTAFVLTHLRNGQENKDDRTSAAIHPLFGDAIAKGLPLVDAYVLTPTT